MIRLAHQSDLSGIEKLCNASATSAHWSIEVYARMLRGEGPQRLFLVAEDSTDALTGILVALRETDEWELENIVVAEECRRKGVARQLMQRLLDEAEAQSASAILLEVRASNWAARNLYQSCGFSQTATRKSYYSNPLEDAVVMTKKLKNRHSKLVE